MRPGLGAEFPSLLQALHMNRVGAYGAFTAISPKLPTGTAGRRRTANSVTVPPAPLAT